VFEIIVVFFKMFFYLKILFKLGGGGVDCLSHAKAKEFHKQK